MSKLRPAPASAKATAGRPAAARAAPAALAAVPVFRAAARRLVRRWLLVRWLLSLGRTALPVFGAAALLLLALRLAGLDLAARGALLPAAAFGLLLAWVALPALRAWRARPAPAAALALWDALAGRHELFVSALAFEGAPANGPGERLHLARARAALPGELAALPRHLPARLAHPAWAGPLLLAGMLLLGALWRPPRAAEDRPLAAADRERAQAAGRTLDEDRKLLDPLQGLAEEERERLEKLQQSLSQTARKLEQLGDETPREVLAELERRAREAELLAGEFGRGEKGLLSPGMLAELERHADTADLAAALRAENLEQIAKEAEKLAQRLEGELSLEERARLENALARAVAAATPEDRQGLVGRHLIAAQAELSQRRLNEAAEELRRMAKQFDRLAQRDQARRQLQTLADSLRRAGQQIFGRAPTETRRLETLPLPDPFDGSRRRFRPGLGRPGGKLPLPSAGRNGRPWSPLDWDPPQLGPLAPGGEDGDFPIPGCDPGQFPGCDLGQTPIPGTARVARAGGSDAGRGAAPYADRPTERLAASGTGALSAFSGQDGPSEFQSVESQGHREAARRSGREVALRAIQEEEAALSEETLPLSRREQVRRYFSALRRQIEDERP